MADDYDIVIAGMGGQGSILASYLLAEAAVVDGIPVLSTGDYGMAQRGGMVTTHLRLGKKPRAQRIPMGRADMLIGCEPSEALRNIGAVKNDGAVILDTLVNIPIPVYSDKDAVYPDIGEIKNRFKSNFDNVYPINASQIAMDFGNPRVMNTILLGTAFALEEIPISTESMIAIFNKQMRPELAEVNIKAFKEGETQLKNLL
jgi:indolepyruvate ferredoxin oxidoreductase beta subunit